MKSNVTDHQGGGPIIIIISRREAVAKVSVFGHIIVTAGIVPLLGRLLGQTLLVTTVLML
jgi:hypothetical protein